jgi:transposase
MKSAMEPLPEDVEKLKMLLLSERHQAALKDAQKDQEIERLKQSYQNLLEQFRLAQHKRFGPSSESSDQLGLFNEAEVEVEEEAVEEDTLTADSQLRKQRPKRKPLPRELPRERVVHDLDDKTCNCCGHDLHAIGEETSEKLQFIPAQIKVIEHIRLKYACRHCEQQGTETPIKTPPVPASPIPKSIATPSLLAQIITSKYQYALPLYRQETLFSQYGIDLNRKTMAEWVIKSSEWLKRLHQSLKNIQLQQAVIQADETPLKVIHEDKEKCYMWVYCTGTDSPEAQMAVGLPNIVLYDYQNSRGGQCPKDYLGDYRGYLQVDGYVGYDQTQATRVGCFAHARRKFVEAMQAQPKGKTGKANWAIAHLKKLYRIENEIKARTVEEKQALRKEHAEPLLIEFKKWLDKSALQVPPKSAIGKAIAYSLNQWPKLIRYLEDGRLSIDNNRAERAIKPFVIGRKNWLFSNTARGAKASAILYSVIETAKANGLVPFDYLNYLLEELPRKPETIEHLLPWNVKLDES